MGVQGGGRICWSNPPENSQMNKAHESRFALRTQLFSRPFGNAAAINHLPPRQDLSKASKTPWRWVTRDGEPQTGGVDWKRTHHPPPFAHPCSSAPLALMVETDGARKDTFMAQ